MVHSRVRACSLCLLAQDEQSGELLSEKSRATFGTSVELIGLDDFKLSSADESINLLLVSFFDTEGPHGVTHGGDENSTHFKGGMNVVKGSVWHVSGHPDAGGGNEIKVVLELVGELVNSSSKEEVVVLRIEASLTDSIEEVSGNVEGVHVGETSGLHGLTNDAGARADIHTDSGAG